MEEAAELLQGDAMPPMVNPAERGHGPPGCNSGPGPSEARDGRGKGGRSFVAGGAVGLQS